MATSTERVRRFRERQAARLEAGPGAPPRDGDDALLPAVEASLAALQLGERDAGMAQTARTLARAVDDAQDRAMALRVFGPQLHRVLESLGGSPAARAKQGTGRQQPQRQAPGKIAQLRSAHAATKARQRRGAS